MIFETHKPNTRIGQHIENIIYFKNFMPDHSKERVIPTGHIFIIFELDGFTRYTYHNETLEPKKEFKEVWVSGAHKNFITISAHEDSEMFVIQFKPYGAYPFFHIPLNAISNKIFHARDIFGDQIVELRQNILAAKEPGDKFELARQWLEFRFDEKKQPADILWKMLEKIEEDKTSTGFDDIFGDYPFTRKHLINQFKRYVGLTPKYYQRILKFNDILAKIHKKETLRWAQLSYDYGFSDQAHFIKTFKHFSGFSPKAFIYEGHSEQDPNFFPLDHEG